MSSSSSVRRPSLDDLERRVSHLEQQQNQDVNTIPKLQQQIDLLQDQIDKLVELLERSVGQSPDQK